MTNKTTPKAELDWLREALPAGYSVEGWGDGIRVRRHLPSGAYIPVLTSRNLPELRTFLQTFVTTADPAVIDTDTGEALRQRRAWQSGSNEEG